MFKCRTGDKRDGCATFYKTSKFQLEESTAVEYLLPDVPLMDRDNVGLVVRLKPVKSSKYNTRLVIGNTHLLFNPRRGDIKLAQLQLLLATMDRMAYNFYFHKRYYPTILCGDMNAEPHCNLFNFLNRGSLKYEGIRIRNMSGQQKKGQDTCLGKQLLPKSQRITDSCQFADDVEARLMHKKQRRPHSRGLIMVDAAGKDEGELSSGDGSDDDDAPSTSRNVSEAQKTQDSNDSTPFDIRKTRDYLRRAKFESGSLQHTLNLRTVYEHRRTWDSSHPIPPREWEVSTHHNNATAAVDYIFYSCHSRQKQRERELVSDRRLKVISRLELLTEREIDKLGLLPNEKVSSDHLCLLVKFALVMN